MPLPFTQAVLSLAALGNALACVGWQGYAVAERMPDGTYVIHRADVPKELSTRWFSVQVEDSVKARLMVAGDRVILQKRGGTWHAEGRQ